MTIEYEYTETFKSTVQDLKLDKEFLNSLLDKFEDALNPFPEGYSAPPELSEMGIQKYKRYPLPEGYSIIYTYDKAEQLVTSHAIVHQRQNIQKLLFNRMIER